ncbi:MAG TPA: sortase [Acidimicrobiia bacterium]|nr:sortase [Acidimicrobiia bacterium]
MRRKIRIAGFALVWTGVFTLGIVGYQLVVTDLLNQRVQTEARDTLVERLAERRDALETPVTVTVPPEETPDTTVPIQPVDFHPETGVEEGDPFGTIRIPTIDVERVLFGGVTPATLNQGPGHMPWTPLPGQPGNSVISGHRTTHGAPFFDLDQLQPGDVIEVETAIGVHRYTVRDTIIVTERDVWVTDPKPGAWLTLTTCHPKFSAAQRLVVQAELTAGPNLDYARLLVETDDPS